MLKLEPQLLERGLAATLFHGYGTFIPDPPELTILKKKKNWAGVKAHLANLDLDLYAGHNPIRIFAPKSKLNVRRVALLHPYDFILYTSLALALKDSISNARLPANRVFSYRSEGSGPKKLYSNSSSWRPFRDAAAERIALNPDGFIGVTDIADFFPRIYQHRLVNALEAASTPAKKPHIRALEKILSRLAEGNSYGIPVGPPASRVLAEAVLIDVDSQLISNGIDFIRFVDDYLIFAPTPQGAEYAIRLLGETLFLNHGLTLQTAKTKVIGANEYLEKYLTLHSEKEEGRRELLHIFGDDEYEVMSYEELDETQKAELDAYNLSEMLSEALATGESVDYREVSFILKRLSALQKPDLIPIVLGNLEKLYPVAESIAAFFSSFKSLTPERKTEIGAALLAPIVQLDNIRPPEYYTIWILSIFQGHAGWNNADTIIRIFRETNSDPVRRFAALALAKCGTRAQVVALKEYFTAGSHLCRTAMLLASEKLGTDERSHFVRSLRITDQLENFCGKGKI